MRVLFGCQPSFIGPVSCRTGSARCRSSAIGSQRQTLPFQMKQKIPFSAGWMRSKWDFLLHLEYGDGDRVRTRARLTKKARGSRSGLSRVKGGPSGVPARRRRATRCGRCAPLRAALENARAFPQLRPLNRVRTRARLTKKARGSRSGLSRVKGGPSGVRTLGLGIKSPLLCQLS